MEQKEQLKILEEKKARNEKIKKIAIYIVIMIVGFILGYNGMLKDAEHPDNPDGFSGGLAVMFEFSLVYFAVIWYLNRKKKKQK